MTKPLAISSAGLPTIAQLQQDFAEGRDKPSQLVARNLASAQAPEGEGSKVFVALDAVKTKQAGKDADAHYSNNDVRPLEGITISIKDLFDVKGEVTTAGAPVMKARAAAEADASAVARLRASGAVIFGRSNMVEFAYSGLGLNRAFGTPRNAWGRQPDGSGRVPGGSTSGGAVSVIDDMCVAALGSDTGGSVRIPAALNGLYGFKPTARRVPITGAVPLAWSLDSAGPLARSVDDCVRIDAVLAAESYQPAQPRDLKSVRLLKPKGLLWDGLDPEVAAACNRALDALRAAGVTIIEAPLLQVQQYYDVGAHGKLVGPEVLQWHDNHVGREGEGYDARIWQRMLPGRNVTRDQYAEVHLYRREWIESVEETVAAFDAIICPTVACIAPEIEPLLASDEAYFKANGLILRNAAWVNFLDGCGFTLPCQRQGEAPVGLQLVGTHGRDRAIIDLAAAVDLALEAVRSA